MITVIVPVYNAERYLQECLQSIVSQTYDDLQIILIDDGSTDNSLSVAREMATRDTRISVLEQAHKGQSAARNAGLEQAKGEYLSFVDADDYIASDYYETLIGNIGDNDVLQIGFKRVSDKGVVLRTVLPRGFYRLTSMCCRLIRREFLMQNKLRFDEGQVYEDVLMSVRLWLKNPQIRILDYTGYFYRQNSISTTSVQRDTKPLFGFLKQQLRDAGSLHHKCVVLLTICRLRLHFFFRR